MDTPKNSGRNQSSIEDATQITEIILTDYFDNQQREKWNKILKEKHGIEQPQKKRAKRIQLYRRLAAAAILLILVTAGIFYAPINQAKTTQDLIALHLEDKKQNTGIRKSGGTTVTIQTNAMAAYEENDYKNAIPLFLKILENKEAKIEYNLFLGLSYLYSQNAKKAIDAFKTARTKTRTTTQDNKEELATSINWYLSLAYLQQKDYKNARKELMAIIENNGRKKEAAQELLISKPLSTYDK